MRVFGPPILLVFVAGCAAGEMSRPERLMSEIEERLTLPKGSLPLSQYARYYSEYGGRVVGVYTTKIEEERPAGVSCEEMLAGGKTKMVSCSAVANLKPGQRRWVSFDEYPTVADEGCLAVHIVYNSSNRSFDSVECATTIH